MKNLEAELKELLDDHPICFTYKEEALIKNGKIMEIRFIGRRKLEKSILALIRKREERILEKEQESFRDAIEMSKQGWVDMGRDEERGKCKKIVKKMIGEEMLPPHKNKDFEKTNNKTLTEADLRNAKRYLENNNHMQLRIGYNQKREENIAIARKYKIL